MQYSPLSVSYQVPLGGSVDGVSVVFKQQNVSFDLAEKMEVWVNGQLMLTKTFFNYYCPTYNTYYQTHNIAGAVCEDNVNVTLNYPGDTITKNEQITYMNNMDSASDINHPETAFESMQSFAIANTKVTDSTVQSWLNNSSQYPKGYKKAMYGTFMTALTTLWLSDKLADEIAPQLNVTWNRNTTTAVMTGVNNNGTAYVHTPDAGMGISVTGGVGDVKNFRFACSLLLSEVEHGAMGATGLSVDSTVSRIISGILNSETFDMIRNGSMVIIMLDGDPSSKIVIDTSTGLVWDLTISNGFQYKGAVSQNIAYCYHDQLTNDILGQVSNWLQNLSGGSNMLSALGGAINGTQQFVVDNWNHIVDIGFGLFELGFGIKTIPTMGIAGPIAIGLILKGEGDIIVGIRNWLVPGNYWQYCSYHNPWPNYKTVSRLNNTKHMIDTIEVPIKDGKKDWDNAVYINAQNGVMT